MRLIVLPMVTFHLFALLRYVTILVINTSISMGIVAPAVVLPVSTLGTLCALTICISKSLMHRTFIIHVEPAKEIGMEKCMQGTPLTDRNIRTGTINAASWGLFSLWIGIAMLAHFSIGVTVLGIGIIILGTQVVSKCTGLTVDLFWIAAGLLIVTAGVCNVLAIKVNLLPFLCIAAGASFLFSIVVGKQPIHTVK
jgi:hypothetical protein